MTWEREYYDATPIWNGKGSEPEEHPPRNRLPTGGGSMRVVFVEKDKLKDILFQFISNNSCMSVYWTDEKRYPMEIWYDQVLGTTDDTRACFKYGHDFIEMFNDHKVLNITIGKRLVDVVIRKVPGVDSYVISVFEYKSDD